MNKGFGLNGILITILIILITGTVGLYVVKKTDIFTEESDSFFVDIPKETNIRLDELTAVFHI